MTKKARVAHVCSDSKHAVGIGSLRVIVKETDDGWFAQGVEIDYAACGESLKDVQKRFESGLRATVHRHLERFESIDRLLKYAPSEVVESMSPSKEFNFDMLTVHDLPDISPLPFGRVAYMEPVYRNG